MTDTLSNEATVTDDADRSTALDRIEEHLAAIRSLLEGVAGGLTSMMGSPMGRIMGGGGARGSGGR